MNEYKPLLSSAPSHSILNAQAFEYTSSVATDVRKTFERIRRARAKATERIGTSPRVLLIRARELA